jgi:hypothetical protein
MFIAIQRSVATDDRAAVGPTPGTDEVRRVLEVVAQALSVIAPLAGGLREKLHQDDDAIAFEIAVRRAVEAIRSLQPAKLDHDDTVESNRITAISSAMPVTKSRP